jgi:hypothetical protein
MKVEVIKEWSNQLGTYQFNIYKDQRYVTGRDTEKEAMAFLDAVINSWVKIEEPKVIYSEVF